MATFSQDIKQSAREAIRDRFEENTGIIGQTLRARRQKAEHVKTVQKQVDIIHKQTTRIKHAGSTLTNIETSFTQMSENLQLVAKALKAQSTTLEETHAAMAADNTKNSQPLLEKKVVQKLVEDKEEESLFDKMFDLMDGLDPRKRRTPPRQRPRGGPKGLSKVGKLEKAATKAKQAAEAAARAAGKSPKAVEAAGRAAAKQIVKKAEKAVIEKAARKVLLKSLGKLVGKSIPVAGAVVGIGFAVAKLVEGDWVGAGVEAVSGLGSAATAIPATIYGAAREIYYEVYGEWPEQDAVNAEERWPDLYGVVKSIASDILADKVVINQSNAETARLNRQSKPVPVTQPSVTLPTTGAGGGRGGRGGATASEAIKSKLTPSQLKWLGNADPTDPYIMARMPAPLPGEEAQKQAPSPAATPVVISPPSVSTPTAKPAPAGPDQKTPGGIVGTVMSALKSAGINSEKAISNILATIKAESGFRIRSENLNYKSAERIQAVFGKKRIPSLDFAQRFVDNPEALANEVYKTTDGNKEAGDGYKYRGRGFIQHTGRNQYEGIKKFTGIDVVSNPDLLNDPSVATKALAWFFLSYKKKTPGQLENMAEVNKAVGFADTTGAEGKHRQESASQIAASMSTGKDMESLSTSVASAKKDKQKGGGNITVVAINNTTKQESRAAPNRPSSQTVATVGA